MVWGVFPGRGITEFSLLSFAGFSTPMHCRSINHQSPATVFSLGLWWFGNMPVNSSTTHRLKVAAWLYHWRPQWGWNCYYLPKSSTWWPQQRSQGTSLLPACPLWGNQCHPGRKPTALTTGPVGKEPRTTCQERWMILQLSQVFKRLQTSGFKSPSSGPRHRKAKTSHRHRALPEFLSYLKW